MKAIMWIRRDLRWKDNRALSIATKEADEVIPVFIFDKNILKHLPKDDHRVTFIYDRLQELQQKHKIQIYYGDPVKIIPRVANEYGADVVYTNEDYESYALERDDKIANKVELKKFLDHIIFHGAEIKTGSKKPYKVYTPYKRNWLATLENHPERIAEFKYQPKKMAFNQTEIERLEDFGFRRTETIPALATDGEKVLKNYLKSANNYKETRDFPALNSTSRLSVHLRFGTVSTRQICREVLKLDQLPESWLSQIIWRDFYYNILQNFPYVEEKPFNLIYEGLGWREDQEAFAAWKQGKTGFPIIDAGMRELNQTGHMHNRVRMIVASFLTKNLLLDWRLGERYFAEKLYDYDLAVNNGSWQWASSTGCDAQPYFRVFNPESQVKKFDKDGEYIKKWVPELKYVPAKFFSNMEKYTLDQQATYGVVIGEHYPHPLVDLKQTRLRAIAHFKSYSSSRS